MPQPPANALPDTPAAEWCQPLSRRQAIHLIGTATGAALVAGCGGGGDTASPSPTPSVTPSPTPTTGSCTKVAEETAGPFPANGSNANAGVNKNVLTDSRVFRSDIRSDLDGSNTQTGIPLTVTMTVLNVNGSCAPLAGCFVYLWHANRTGSYSQYSGNNNGGDFSDRSWLRGVAQANANGQVTFTTVFPGRYAGRATHMHFQVFPDSTPANGEQRATSQLAFPASVTDSSTGPYSNTTLYPTSASNNTSNESDNVFSDGTGTEMLTVTGNNTSGYTATITVSVSG